ncbi:aspartate carbamoyltransferase catalytic subunit [Roseivivax sp. CAU 1761]
MTSMEIRGAERGLVRIFHLDLPAEAVERFTAEAGTGEWPLQYALGADRLKPALIDIVRIRDLGAMALSSYLAEAHNLSGPEFEQARPQLDALTGHVVILPSAAFDATAQTLQVQAPLRWIGTFSEPAATPTGRIPKPEAARGSTGGAGKAAPARGGSGLLKIVLAAVALVILAVLVFAVGGAR